MFASSRHQSCKTETISNFPTLHFFFVFSTNQNLQLGSSAFRLFELVSWKARKMEKDVVGKLLLSPIPWGSIGPAQEIVHNKKIAVS